VAATAGQGAIPDDRYERLFAAARAAHARAYAPYSRFQVGAALLTDDDRVIAGCNVENAAYPQSQCAEATAIGRMVAEGARRIRAALVIGGEVGDGMVCTPCGACRQRLREFMDLDGPLYVCGPEGLRLTTTLATLLPHSFGPDNLKP